MSDRLVVVARLEPTDDVQFNPEWEWIRLFPFNIQKPPPLKIGESWSDRKYRICDGDCCRVLRVLGPMSS